MKEKTTPIKKNPRTVVGWALTHGKPGTVFFSDKSSNTLTAVATYNNRKISIKRMVAVTSHTTEVEVIPIYQVTIIE